MIQSGRAKLYFEPPLIRLFLLLAVFGFFFTGTYGAEQAPSLVRGPYLQQVTSQSIIIRWRTQLPCNSRVLFGTSLSYGGTALDTTTTTEHIVKLQGLLPGSRYYYSIGTLTKIIAGDSSFTFLTAPDPMAPAPVRIWATGDFGNGSTSQADVRDALMHYTGNIPVNLWVWLGDNAYYSGTDSEYQAFVFGMYPEQLKKFALFPAPGNHDYANSGYKSGNSLTTNFPYFQSFSVPRHGECGGVPSLTPKYYSYNYSNIHFISLDSYGSANDSLSAMFQWLESDLAANNLRWTIVYFHHPPYSKGSHDSDREAELIDMRTSIIPLLEKYQVDLVLSGHSHVNERSYFIRGHYGDANTFNSSMKKSNDNRFFLKTASVGGTVYAVCGTSGQNPGAIQLDYPMPCMYFNNNTDNCSMVIDVNGNFLTASYLTKSGTIADRFTISKHDSMSTGDGLFSVYQQPGDPVVILNCLVESVTNLEIELVNAAGQPVFKDPAFRKDLGPGLHRIETNTGSLHLASGIYILNASFSGRRYSEKILITGK